MSEWLFWPQAVHFIQPCLYWSAVKGRMGISRKRGTSGVTSEQDIVVFFPRHGALIQPCQFRGPPREPIPEPAARQRGHRTCSSLLRVALQDAASCDRKHAAQPDRRQAALWPCGPSQISLPVAASRQQGNLTYQIWGGWREGSVPKCRLEGATKKKHLWIYLVNTRFMSQELLSWPLSVLESVLLDKTAASEYDGSSFYTLEFICTTGYNSTKEWYFFTLKLLR